MRLIFIGILRALSYKEETLHIQEKAENPFMGLLLKMKSLKNSNTIHEDFYQWQIKVQVLMEANFSSHTLLRAHLTENTLCLEEQ